MTDCEILHQTQYWNVERIVGVRSTAVKFCYDFTDMEMQNLMIDI